MNVWRRNLEMELTGVVRVSWQSYRATRPPHDRTARPPASNFIYANVQRSTAESCLNHTMIQSVFLFPVLYGVQAFSQSTTHYSRGVIDVAVWTFHQHLPPYPTSDPVQFLHTNVYQFQLGLLQEPHLERRGQPGFYCRPLPKRARSREHRQLVSPRASGPVSGGQLRGQQHGRRAV